MKISQNEASKLQQVLKIELDEEDSLGKLYKRPWNDPQADNFTVKVRYRF